MLIIDNSTQDEKKEETTHDFELVDKHNVDADERTYILAHMVTKAVGMNLIGNIITPQEGIESNKEIYEKQDHVSE